VQWGGLTSVGDFSISCLLHDLVKLGEKLIKTGLISKIPNNKKIISSQQMIFCK